MKQFILKIAWQPVIPLITLMFALLSCDSKEGGRANIKHDPNKPIVITSFEPDSGRLREMVLIDGENFGSDNSIIKVFFNSAEAKVVGSTGSTILALVPRMPGDTCVLSVQINSQTDEYEQKKFFYKMDATVTTIAGNGERRANYEPVWDQGLDKTVLTPVYIGIDRDDNVLVTAGRTGPDEDYLFRINPRESTISLVATRSQHGFRHRCAPYVNPQTNVIQMGTEDNTRDNFLFIDPKDGWAPKPMYIKTWDWNGMSEMTSANNGFRHFHILLNEEDGYFYTRYESGLIAKIDPVTWHAQAVGYTARGYALGMAFNPIRKSELWIGFYENASTNQPDANGICMVDVSDTTRYWSENPSNPYLLKSYKKMSHPVTANNLHRDGPLEQAQFYQIRMISFDSQGNLYVGDCGNHCIRMVNTKTMMVSTIIGIPKVSTPFRDGNKDYATFNQPHGIVVDSQDIIYVADYSNNRVRRIAIE